MSEDFRISAVRARQVLDSRATPTVEAEVWLGGGALGRAAVPSGASTGGHEARELRDTDDPAWAGRSVGRAVANVDAVLGPAVTGLDARDQEDVDSMLRAADGTDGFSRLGANAALAVSLATARAAAAAADLPLYAHIAQLVGTLPLLPLPMVNMISGGAHAGRNLDIQDVLAIPVGAASYTAGLEVIVRVYWALRGLLVEAGYPPLVGDEGGFGPSLDANEQALALVTRAIERAALRPGEDVALALDVAATGLARDGAYYLERDGGPAGRVPSHRLDAPGMVALVEDWAGRYPLVSVEDALAEDDWEGWRLLTARLGHRLQLVGDDLFTTNVDRLRHGVEVGAANAVLVKVNQIGTLTGALEALRLAWASGYRAVISARSGETEDEWLADLAVGSGAGQIKVGSVARSERLAKYNRLLRIEEELGLAAPYAGGAAWRPGGQGS
jgi:enolase